MAISHDVLYDKIYGCWLGKNIGGTLGTAPEGQKNPTPLPYEFPAGNEPNDDLDLQLVWLDMIRRKGLLLNKEDFSEAWVNHISYPFDEYGIARANLIRGLRAPESGKFNNYFLNCMGSPIRSEIWGCIAAGNPDCAAAFARMDAEVDHDDEGVYGEIFFAAAEAIAFEESNPLTIVKRALAYLPETSVVKQAVLLTVDAYENKTPLAELRLGLINEYDAGNFTHCVLNIAFTIAGVLYEELDFLRTMVTSINLGYDTDCTGATSGALVGIILGAKKIQDIYQIKFDNRILSGWGVFDITVPPTLEAFTDECIKLHGDLEKMSEPPRLSVGFELPFVDVSSYDLNRQFRVGAFADAKEAAAGLGNARKSVSKIDYLVLTDAVVPGKKLYLATTVTSDEKPIRIFGHSNCATRTWVNGLEVANLSARDFAPSPHRHWGETKPIDFSGTAKVLVEITPEANKAVEFQLLVATEERKYPVPYYTLTAE